MSTTPVGQAIRFVRMSSDMSQEELAEKAGTTRSYISQIEVGTRGEPSLSMVQKICTALDISMTLLFILVEREDKFVRPIMPLAYLELADRGRFDE